VDHPQVALELLSERVFRAVPQPGEAGRLEWGLGCRLAGAGSGLMGGLAPGCMRQPTAPSPSSRPPLPAAEVAIRRAGGVRAVLLRAGVDLGLSLSPAQVAAETGRPWPPALPAAPQQGQQGQQLAQEEGGAGGEAGTAAAVEAQQQASAASAAAGGGGGGGEPKAAPAAPGGSSADAAQQLGAGSMLMPSFDWAPDEEVYFWSRHYEPIMQVGGAAASGLGCRVCR
jgi:hypothetical protein